ncbi:MAG: UDP-N-acetylmuramoyl-L-alanyl-D-glutamate--2,6-diaminopimelate ligase [Myxococcales bacterium]|nr:UDP-N-acetylmuramoyl-L-alanyl-D-glutamate--2,6-diaminopimelate ligase [Myxococcales bacterium]
MMLGHLANQIPGATLSGEPNTEVLAVTHDSRKVGPGTLFVALPGRTVDGLTFAPAAIQRGAVAIAVEAQARFDCDLPLLTLPHPRQGLAVLAAELCGRPADQLFVIGVTGTNGKTTVSSIISEICMAAGIISGQIGTNGHRVGSESLPAQFTTPEAPQLQNLLRAMVDRRAQLVAMEVSSVGLEEHRVDGISFDACAFLNLTVDHLDYHGSMDSYGKAKARLFLERLSESGTAVLCVDDQYGIQLERELRRNRPTIDIRTVSLDNRDAGIHFEHLEINHSGLAGRLRTPDGCFDIDSPMLGRFNALNLAVAVGLCQYAGVSNESIQHGIAVAQVRGRLQRISNDRGFDVIVDYAHSPDALESVIGTIKDVCVGRLWLVFGCGGDRDTSKRKPMGRISGRADAVIVTNDNPRSETPQSIADEIVIGAIEAGLDFSSDACLGSVCVELDRASAIRRAINAAQPGDFVLIAGKGHETYQEQNGVRSDFDDLEVARRILTEGLPC